MPRSPSRPRKHRAADANDCQARVSRAPRRRHGGWASRVFCFSWRAARRVARMEWLESMHRIRALKLELARMDPRRGMPIAPPAGAAEAAIAGVERRLGMPLPPSYRELLS